MKVFVTGGSGFVGGHVIERLCAEGHQVDAMARSDKSAEVVRGFGANAVRASLDEVSAEHLEGADVVIHAAAYVEEWGEREVYERVNVEGTRRMLDAARGANVKRFILIGTEAALFDGSALVQIDESHPYPDTHRFLYSETKARAEQLVLAANSESFHTLSLRPRLVWGPRDTSVLPAVERMVEEGSFAWLDGGRALTSTTHVANLCEAIIRALEHGEGGRAYFISDGEETTLRAFLGGLLEQRGVTPPKRSIPGVVARLAARVVEGVWGLLGVARTPPMTSFSVEMMSRQVTVRIDRARAELGYEPIVSVADGMRSIEAS